MPVEPDFSEGIVAPRMVGRKTRRAHGLAGLLCKRAGFEPFRGCHMNGRGSKPARLNRWVKGIVGAPSFSPYLKRFVR